MYLCMDDNGRVYQSASYRADGKGFEKEADLVDASDVCLGSPYLKQNKMVQTEHQMLQKFNIAQDEMDLKQASNRRIQQQNQMRRQHQEELLRDIPAYQGQLLKEAAIQTMSGADFSTNSVWGYSSGKFANGLGRTNQQILAEAAVRQSMGEVPNEAEMAQEYNVTASTDPYEIEQWQLKKEADAKINQVNQDYAINRERELYQQKEMSKKAHIDSVQDSKLVDPQATYIESDTTKASSNMKKAGIALGVLAIFNMLR